MKKTISKEEAIKEIKTALDRHLESDSLDSADFIAELLATLRGKTVKANEDGEIETNDYDEDSVREYVAGMVADGYICGFSPEWTLWLEDEETRQDTVALRMISELIRGGYREGYTPRWTIKF